MGIYYLKKTRIWRSCCKGERLLKIFVGHFEIFLGFKIFLSLCWWDEWSKMCEFYVEFHGSPNVTHTCKRKRKKNNKVMDCISKHAQWIWHIYSGCFQYIEGNWGTLQMVHHQKIDFVKDLLCGLSQPMIAQILIPK